MFFPPPQKKTLVPGEDVPDCQLGVDGIVGTCDAAEVGTLLIGAEGSCDEGVEGELTQIAEA